VDRIVTDIYQGLAAPNNLLHIEAVSKAYDEVLLFDGVTLDVYRGDRVAVIGPNGCGKTTLLRILLGDEAPDRGHITWAKGAAFVHYNQVFEELEASDTVTHAVNVIGLAYSAPRKRVNRFLSLLGFSEMDLGQRIGTLSGGQKARVALAKCLLSGANVVVLDEPTNHLDMPSTQVMERALARFPGAVIVASHDRFFIDKLATRLLVFDQDHQVRDVAGSWTIWQASLGEMA
jgi:ATP-binding cassette subfamily F protein 3